jgi:phosphoglucomutase
VVCEDPDTIAIAFHKLRHTTTSKISYIKKFGNCEVTKIKDVSLGYDSTSDVSPQDKYISPSDEMIMFMLGSTMMTLRGSGTEPKLKYYIESKAETMEGAQSEAEKVEDALKGVLRKFGLQV